MADANQIAVPEARAFRSDDRVLLLKIPAVESLAALGRILSHGVLVALGTRGEVDLARQSLLEFDNVMFVEGDSEHIPWRDSYFSKVVAPPGSSPTAEVARVLAPGGTILRPPPPGTLRGDPTHKTVR